MGKIHIDLTFKYLLSLLILSVFPLKLFSQDLMFRNISVEDGLSNNFVTAIHQDSRGYMWFGTLDGLDRFDGSEIRSYGHKFPRQPVKVNRIINDPDHGIWIGTDSGLFYWDFVSESFNEVPLSDKTLAITSLLFLPGDTLLLAGTTEGLWLLNNSTQVAELIPLQENRNNSIQVTDALLNGSDLWVTTTSSLLKITLPDLNVQIFRNEGNSPAYNNFSSLAVYNNTIVAGTQTRGLFTFDILKNTFSPFVDIGNSSIHVVKYDPKGYLYVGTDGGGLIILDLKDYSYKTYRKEVSYPNSLNSSAVYSLYVDQNGRYWIGTYSGGVNYNTAYEGGFQVSVFENGLFLGQNSIRSLYFDKAGNKFIGTRLGFYVSKATGETFYFNKENSSLESNVILSLKHHQEHILIGTFRGGAAKYNIKTNRLEPFNRNVLPSSGSVYGFEYDTTGNLLIATMEGLYVQDANSGVVHHFTTINSELEDSRLISILVDSEGRVWLGSIGAGISVYSLEDLQLVQIPDNMGLSKYKAVSFFEDSKKNIWISSEQGGLIKISSELKDKAIFTVDNGLPNNSVTAVTEAPENIFWITTLKGLTRLDGYSGNFRNYTLSHGLPSLVFNRGAISNSYDEDGRIWLGTESGLVSFMPDNIDKNKPNENVTVTDFYVDGENYLPAGLNRPIEQLRQITIKGKKTSIGFRYTALNYFNPTDNLYLYRLWGKDDEWQSSSANHVSYSNLKPGKYTFQVRLSGGVTIDDLNTTSIDILIKPYWYQQASFKILVSAVFLFLIVVTLKIIYDLRRRVHKIQEVKDTTKETHKKYESSNLSAERSKEIEVLLKGHVEDSKIYLDPDLKLLGLAAAIDCSPHDVSQVINQNLNQSYYEFINRYRIEEVKKRMSDPAYKKYTLLAIAQECGFNSKTSFYRAFKKLTGLTPIQYQNQLSRHQTVNAS